MHQFLNTTLNQIVKALDKEGVPSVLLKGNLISYSETLRTEPQAYMSWGLKSKSSYLSSLPQRTKNVQRIPKKIWYKMQENQKVGGPQD